MSSRARTMDERSPQNSIATASSHAKKTEARETAKLPPRVTEENYTLSLIKSLHRLIRRCAHWLRGAAWG